VEERGGGYLRSQIFVKATALLSAKYNFRYTAQRMGATRIQAAVRGRQQRTRFLASRASAVRIQTAWRGAAARVLCRRMRAARTLQRHCRGFAVRRRLHSQRASATRIQVLLCGPLRERKV